MDKAKAAVNDFLHHSGQNDTTVHEKVAPAVTKETIQQTHHEEIQPVIDRERHQDHHHTTVQPVADKQVLPEQHSHSMGTVESRNIQHGNDADIASRLERERAQFHDTQTQGASRTTQSTNAAVTGEHVHHHVHETIQPVVQKETIQPDVVHTTVPLHEVHHHEAKHHAASALPAMSMADFQKQGGSLTGRAERVDGFEGEPRPLGSSLGSQSIDSQHRGNAGAGPHDSKLGNKADPRVDSDLDGSRNAGLRQTTGGGDYSSGTTGTGTGTGLGGTGGNRHTGTSGTGLGSSTGATGTGLGSSTGATGSGFGSNTGTTGSGLGSNVGTTGSRTGTSGTGNTGAAGAGPHNSGLLNKADPRVDSDRDGKKGLAD